jgi:outer membrane usher protein
MYPFTIMANAELYFAPELVSADPQTVADLSRFEKSGAQLPGNYQVDIYINGKRSANRNLDFIDANAVKGNTLDGGKAASDIRDNTGLMACLTLAELERLGVNVKPFLASSDITPEQCISPGKYIPDAFTIFDFPRMRLDVSIPQAAMQNGARGEIAPERWDEGIDAALLNYSFSGNTSQGSNGDSSNHYLNLNSGLNIGAWRLRDFRTWNDSNSPYYHRREWQHIKTYAERTVSPWRSSLLLGDSSTSGDVFDSLGFRGVQIATEDSMYPDSLRGFAPMVRGTAHTNARVSIRQNGYTVYQTFVSPGEFIINDLYPMSSSGDLEVTVTEADGNIQVFIVPFSSVPILQREGHLKYALTAGRYQAASSNYRNPEFVQGTFIWGGPHNITLYGGVQYTQNYLSGLLGGGLNLGVMGALSADVTIADSTLADGSRQQGQSLRFLYARSLNSLGTTFQLTGYRYSTRGFHTLDETTLTEMSGWRNDIDRVDAEGRPYKRTYTDYYNLYNNKRAKIQASISQRVGEQGSIYLSGSMQTYWNAQGASDSLQVGFNSAIGSVSYNLSYSYTRESSLPEADQSVFLSLSIPLFTGGDGNSHSIYATYNTSRSRDRKTTQQAGLSGTLLDTKNLNWSVSQGYEQSEGNSGNLSASYQGGYGNRSLGYSYSNNYRQVNYGVSGGAILHKEGLTLGQSFGETSVLIAAPGMSDVAVENETGVKTDWRGYAIKPYASIYRENRVALDLSSLDEQTDIDDSVSRVIPTKGAVVQASFIGYTGSRILMGLTYNDKPLPFGAMVTAGERGGIVGDDGQVYLSGMPDKGMVRAEWGGAEKHCTSQYSLSEKDKSQPVIRIEATCR